MFVGFFYFLIFMHKINFKNKLMKKITLLFFMFLSVFASAQLSEGFEGTTFPPTGWTVESANPAMTWAQRAAGQVGKDATVAWDYDQDEFLITPVFTIPAGSPVLTFKLSMSYYWGVDPNDNYNFLVHVSTDNGGTWEQIWDETALGVFPNFTTQDIVIPLTAYAGTTDAMLKFEYVGSDGASLYLDEINVVAAPASVPDCATLVSPADAATNVGVGTVTFSWNAPTTGEAPTSYDLYGGTTLPLGTANLVGNYTTTTASIVIGDYDTLFYWMIVPKNLAGEATGCTTFSFTTQSPQAYCLYAENGQWPTAAYTPAACDGTTSNSITTGGYAGEFSAVNVVAGNTYQFISSNATDKVTISADGGVTAAAYGVASVTWTATTTGVARFYTHLNDGLCGAQSVNRSRSVICTQSLSLNDFDSNETLKYYPNPVKNILSLTNDKNISNVKVFNLLGQQVLVQLGVANQTQIDMSELSSGTYFVKVTSDNQVKTIKVVKE